ncbi:hypothetical protein GE061_010918, partial [Apolygus lucorum]
MRIRVSGTPNSGSFADILALNELTSRRAAALGSTGEGIRLRRGPEAVPAGAIVRRSHPRESPRPSPGRTPPSWSVPRRSSQLLSPRPTDPSQSHARPHPQSDSLSPREVQSGSVMVWQCRASVSLAAGLLLASILLQPALSHVIK